MREKNTIRIFFGLYCNTGIAIPYDSFHRHDEFEMLFFQTDGPVVIRFGGQVIKLRSEQTVLFWGAIPHQLVEISPRNIQYWLTIPPAIFLRWDLPRPLTRELLNGKILIESDPVMREIDRHFFPLWKREAGSPESATVRNYLLSLEIRFRRFRQYSIFPKEKAVGPTRREKGENSSFLGMYDFITKNFTEPLTIGSIASSIGVHPNYACTLFHTSCGIRITEFIQMLRVYEAQRLLLTTGINISTIAKAAGFGSKAMFYECFERFCRKRPGDYRKHIEQEGLFDTPPEKLVERQRRELMYGIPLRNGLRN